VEGFPTRGGLSLGDSDIGDPALLEVCPKTSRGRFEAAGPDSSGFIAGVEGKSHNDRPWVLTCPGLEPSLWLIRTESGGRGRDSGYGEAIRDGDGARIKYKRLRRWLSPMVVARSVVRYSASPRRGLLFRINRTRDETR
jgi:hypothetical protein